MSEFNLDGKTVIVTGGASGIGKAVAVRLAREGTHVVVADVNEQAGQATVNELGQDRHLFVKTDVTGKDSVDGMVKAVLEQYGAIDILVNNAGVNVPRLLVDRAGREELTEPLWDLTVKVNQKGAFLCAQAVAREMIRRGEGGVIVNMASESGLEGSEGQSAYAATKAALYSCTRSWAKELGKYGVRVVAVAPGILEPTALRTEEYERALAYTRGLTLEELRAAYEKVAIPLGRVGTLEEVADAVCFLASDMASYITGTVLNISGGKSRA